MNINIQIAEKIFAIPSYNVALCLAKIATVWMDDRGKIASSKELGADEISDVTEAFEELGIWPDDSGNFPKDEEPPAAVQVDLFNNI
jgi:hypothetical protein